MSTIGLLKSEEWLTKSDYREEGVRFVTQEYYCMQTELDDTRSYYQLIINIVLSEELRKDKKPLKISENSLIYDFVQNLGFWDIVVAPIMVITLKFVTVSFQMQSF